MSQGKDGTYRLLVWAAIATAVIVAGATVYQYLFVNPEAGNLEYRRGNLRLEDGLYAEALKEFDTVLTEHPEHAPSQLGRALALMAMGRDEEALQAFDAALALQPKFAAVYANRGILYDREGRYEDALHDYRTALEINPDLADGPGWITRFFRLQYNRPPTIADRARYLAEQLARPPEERLLRVPERDDKQRMYKVEGLVGSDQ